METLLSISSYDASLGYYEVESAALFDLATLNAQIIDVREPVEFHGELGHLRDARLLPLAKLPSAALALDRTQSYLLICRSGRRSGQAAQLLSELGFPKVVNLRGGMLDYREVEKSRTTL